MKRIAYLSPLNPAPSGISDYSEELLPYLAQYAELTLYVDAGLKPNNAQLLRHMAVRPISRLERDQRRRPYDAILYHIGNSPVHAGIWRMMQRVPGVVVLHEFVLHHFMLNYAATALRDVEVYRAEAARRYGAEGERVANLMLHGRFTEAAFDLPFCEPVLGAAEGLIAHSRYVLDRVTALRPELPAAHVPMGVPLPPPIGRAEAREHRGLPVDAPILASFGHINPYKRLEAVFRALHDLRESYPGLRYLLVGSVSPNYDVRAAVARAGLGQVVTITGYVDRAAFEEYVAAADICVNLRHPTAGETSASLLRLLGAGRPTLVTASGSFAELPVGVAAQVDPDAGEGELIAAYCRLLLERPDLAAALGQSARAYVAREHTLEGAAAGYMRFLATHYGWGEPQKIREQPLWGLTDDRRPTTKNREPRTTESQVTSAENGTRHATRDTRHTTSLSMLNSQFAPVAQALAELGATESDAPLLEGTARAAAELFGAE
ncbi:MAG TPA: glycosyltransferase family 4 protein [Roseiflexaceae bacterium]|nr:glycosyltransferase family 4 protein [Roseiflexaceae bacterium]